MDSVELSLFEALQLSPGGLRELEQSSDSELSEPSETENIISKLQREREQHMAQIAHSFNVSTPAGFVLEADTEALKEFESEQKTSDGAVSEQWINRYFTRANESGMYIRILLHLTGCGELRQRFTHIICSIESFTSRQKRHKSIGHRNQFTFINANHYIITFYFNIKAQLTCIPDRRRKDFWNKIPLLLINSFFPSY
jgi:sarcosine oxidase delta subunit